MALDDKAPRPKFAMREAMDGFLLIVMLVVYVVISYGQS
jgi:competence protein ComGC